MSFNGLAGMEVWGENSRSLSTFLIVGVPRLTLFNGTPEQFYRQNLRGNVHLSMFWTVISRLRAAKRITVNGRLQNRNDSTKI